LAQRDKARCPYYMQLSQDFNPGSRIRKDYFALVSLVFKVLFSRSPNSFFYFIIGIFFLKEKFWEENSMNWFRMVIISFSFSQPNGFSIKLHFGLFPHRELGVPLHLYK
jgi:hypothetical protein